MPSPVLPRWRAALRFDLLNDLLRANLLAAIAEVAPSSVLMKNPAVAASVAMLIQKGHELAADIEEVASLQKQLDAAIASRAIRRRLVDLQLDTLKTLVENNAMNGSDVTSMGFPLLTPTKPSQTPPDAPLPLVVKVGRRHGHARVSVPGAGYQGRFAAEIAQSQNGPWSPLPGTSKSRSFRGYPSGTQLWVRFAAVRFGLQGPWGTAVLVTIP
jgi:hypothetical protein